MFENLCGRSRILSVLCVVLAPPAWAEVNYSEIFVGQSIVVAEEACGVDGPGYWKCDVAFSSGEVENIERARVGLGGGIEFFDVPNPPDPVLYVGITEADVIDQVIWEIPQDFSLLSFLMSSLMATRSLDWDFSRRQFSELRAGNRNTVYASFDEGQLSVGLSADPFLPDGSEHSTGFFLRITQRSVASGQQFLISERPDL